MSHKITLIYTYLTVEPITNQAGLWTFGIIILGGFVSLFYFVIRGGDKEEQSKTAAQEREKADLRVVHKEVDPKDKVVKLDEYEENLGGDYPNVSGTQNN